MCFLCSHWGSTIVLDIFCVLPVSCSGLVVSTCVSNWLERLVYKMTSYCVLMERALGSKSRAVRRTPSVVFTSVFHYRATLCVSAVFAVARCLSVCLSFRPSVTLVYCIHTAEDIVKLLSRSGSPIILVFFIPSAAIQFQGDPLQRGRKIHGGGKI